jgi:putative ABC transport system permease protein
MDFFLQDLRYGLRGLRNQPSFTALAVLTLALGIGAATTMFSVIQNVLLDPFPYKDANSVVAFQIRDANRANEGGRSYFQTPEFLDYVNSAQVFEDVIAGTQTDVRYRTDIGTEQLTGGLMSGNAFEFLGVPAAIGRTLSPEDGRPGAPPVFVMSYKMWRKFFDLDAAILGKTFIFDDEPRTLVGIMPQRFTKLNADVYFPVILDRADPKVNEQYFLLQAKLKPGVTLSKAEAELTLIAQRLAKIYPRNYPENGRFIVKVVSWVDNIVGRFRETLLSLAGAVALLLLIACANVANMLLARAAAREKEIALRAALGASRSRLVVQLLVESSLLALMGAVVGCGFAYFGVKALVPMIPDGFIPHEAAIRLNVPVLIFSMATAVVTAVIFGLVPALQAARQDLVESLKDGQKGGSGFRRGKFRSGLVVMEVALSLVLLTGAGLLMRNFLKLTTSELGFDPKNILVTQLSHPRGKYDEAVGKQQYFNQLLTRLQALPGVVAATTANALPPYGGPRSEIDISGTTHSETWNALLQLCSPGYLQTLGRNVVRGRWLTEQDVNDARRVAVVNQTFVNRYLAGQDPIGRQVTFKRFASLADVGPSKSTFEIIGVLADIKNQGLENPPVPEALLPFSITGAFDRGVMLRTAGEPLAMINTLQREIWAQDRSVAMTLTDSLGNLLKRYSYAGPRFSLAVLGVFASLGLILVTLGVYSVIAYTVSRQTREIGIRMALGAPRGNVLGLVLRMGLQLIGLGVICGVAFSLGTTRIVASQLRDVEPYDVPTLLGGVVLVTLAGFAACYFPAKRATRVDPMIALRHD